MTEFVETHIAKREADLLPNYSQAIVPMEKLTGYVLNMNHPEGKEKAIAFRNVLGYTKSNAEQLKKALEDGVKKWKATERDKTEYGQPYEVKMALTGVNGRQATVKTGWQIDTGELAPRLTTAYIYDEKG